MRNPSPYPRADPEREFAYFTPSAREAILWIRELQDEELENPAALLSEIGEGTNPRWIEAECMAEKYARDLIDDRTYSRWQEDH